MERGASNAMPLSYCSKCHSPTLRAGQKFCRNCGSLLIQEEEPAPSSEIGGIESMLPRVDALRKVASAREAYFQLGLQLRADKNDNAAIQALEQALKEPGSKPELKDILLPLAYACDMAGERTRAFSAWLELVAAGFPAIRSALLRAARHLTPSEASAQETFMVGDWMPRFDRHAGKQERAYLKSFVGIAHVCMGREDDAMSWFRDAAAADETVARSFVPELLTTATLLPAQSGDSLEAHYLRARIFQAVGDISTALTHCDLSLKGQPFQQASYPDAPVRRLRAELAEAAGDFQGAAAHYYEAGRRYGWRDEHPVAVEVLERASKLDEKSALVRWQLSDMLLRMGERVPTDVDANEIASIQCAHLRRALRVWDEGMALGRPGPDESWVYLSRAFITMRLSDLEDSSDRGKEYWEAVALGEQGALLGPSEPIRWGNLSYLYRKVNTQRAPLLCARHGFEVNAESAEVLEELALNLTNLGFYKEAAEIIARCSPGPWNEYVLAHLCLYTDDTDEAKAHIRNSLKEAPTELRYLWTLGLIEAFAGDGLKVFEDIAREHGEDPPAEQTATVAFACYATGNFPVAISLLQTDLQTGLPTDHGLTHFILALAYLGNGQVADAQLSFERSAPLLRDLESAELCRIYLKFASELRGSSPQPKEAAQMLDLQRGAVDQLAAKFHERLEADDLEAAIEELEAKLASDGPSNPWCAVASVAGIARMQLARREWKPALEKYRTLAKQPERFMESARGIAAVVDTIVTINDELLMQGGADEAMAGYAEAIRIHAEAATDAVKLASLKARFAYASAASDRPQSRQYFEEAIFAYRAAGLAEAAAMAADLLPLIPSRPEYRRLDQLLANIALASSEKSTIGDVRRALQAYLDRSFKLAASDCPSFNMYTMVTPVAFEFDADLALPGPPDQWPLFTTHVPEVRKRIEEEMGVTIPGVRVRVDTEDMMPGATYLIMLHEVPIVMQSVKLDHWFVRQSSETLAKIGIDGEFSRDPASNDDGCWVAADALEKIEAEGLGPCVDVQEFIARHLEALLKTNLAHFVDAQEIQRLLDEWSKEPDGPDLIRTALPQDAARLRFGRLIRALLEEGVSVSNWRDILDVVRREGIENDDVSELLIRVRLRLQGTLIAAAAKRERLDVPASLEADLLPCLIRQDGATVFAMTPEQTQNALAEFREQLPEGDCVLVVSHPEIRQPIRRLVQLEFPRAMVASRAELQAEGAA